MALLPWAATLPAHAVIMKGGNGIYRIAVGDDANLLRCGTWLALTGEMHPAGVNRELLFNAGGTANPLPVSSYTSLHSYTSNLNYTSGALLDCLSFCEVATPTIETLQDNGTTIGFRMSWVFGDPPFGFGTFPAPTIEFVQEVVVVGPTDGTETIDNTVIRETHIVRNAGPGPLRYGLRKLWDLQIDEDDGPWIGDCGTPDEACDKAMNLTADGTIDGFTPRNYVVNGDPAFATCPPGILPKNPAGCGGAPSYVVAGTVGPPSALVPPPDPPEVLQFNHWSFAFGECWTDSILFDGALCGSSGGFFDDTALAYYYGFSEETAELLLTGEERSYTQYLTAGLTTCPAAITTGGVGEEPTDGNWLEYGLDSPVGDREMRDSSTGADRTRGRDVRRRGR